jgi:hypothetical protein
MTGDGRGQPVPHRRRAMAYKVVHEPLGYFRLPPISGAIADLAGRRRWADAVEKVENRSTPKISQKVIFGLHRRCDAL